MNEITHRMIALLVFVFIPASILVSVFETTKNEIVQAGIAVAIIAWYIYLNMWSKLAARFYREDSVLLVAAWTLARRVLNNDILIGLTNLPVVGAHLERWIKRNSSE